MPLVIALPRRTIFKALLTRRPVHEWAERRDTETLQYLLDTGADVNATNDRGQTVATRFMIEIGNIVRDAYHASQDNYSSFKMIIVARARIDVTDNRGQTLLDQFALSLDQMVKMVDGFGNSDAVLLSTQASALQCLELLIRLGADPRVEENEGKRPVDTLRGRCTAENRACLGSKLAIFFGFDRGDSTGVSQEAGSRNTVPAG